ncbi:MAG: hypothetical protein P4N59_05405 [Negativicutes bacterium]|nr:hypothetical protein [Negativicutes bacterium]
MFDYEPPEDKEPVDYTGLLIGVMVAPVFFLFTFLYNADAGLAACIVLAVILFAIKLRWYLRKHVWFWAIIAVILALHVPLVFMVRWPQGHAPTLFYTMPLGIADFLIIQGAVGLAEKVFAKGSSSNDENE